MSEIDKCPVKSVRFQGEEFQLECDLPVGHYGSHCFTEECHDDSYEPVAYLIRWTIAISLKGQIAIGDTIRATELPAGVADVEVLYIKPCESGGAAEHPAYLIRDPETDKLDWVCSRDFTKAGE